MPGKFLGCTIGNYFLPRTLDRQDTFFDNMKTTWSTKNQVISPTIQVLDLSINYIALDYTFPNLDFETYGMTILLTFAKNYTSKFYVHQADMQNTFGSEYGHQMSFTTSYFHQNRDLIRFKINFEMKDQANEVNLPDFDWDSKIIQAVQIFEGRFKNVQAIDGVYDSFVEVDGSFRSGGIFEPVLNSFSLIPVNQAKFDCPSAEEELILKFDRGVEKFCHFFVFFGIF